MEDRQPIRVTNILTGKEDRIGDILLRKMDGRYVVSIVSDKKQGLYYKDELVRAFEETKRDIAI